MITEPVIHSAPNAPYSHNGAASGIIIVGAAVAAGSAAPTGRHRPAPATNEILFVLGQNFPNPHQGQTTIPFALTEAADVRLSLFDLAGRKVVGIIRKGLTASEHTIVLNLTGLGLTTGSYHYQLQVSSSHATTCQQKTMTTT